MAVAGAVASRLEALRDDTLPLTSTVSASDLPVPHTDFRARAGQGAGQLLPALPRLQLRHTLWAPCQVSPTYALRSTGALPKSGWSGLAEIHLP